MIKCMAKASTPMQMAIDTRASGRTARDMAKASTPMQMAIDTICMTGFGDTVDSADNAVPGAVGLFASSWVRKAIFRLYFGLRSAG